MNGHTNTADITLDRRPSRLVRLTALTAMFATLAGAVLPSGPATAGESIDCTIYWDAGAGTVNWTDAANWSDDRLPGADDAVCVLAGMAPEGVLLDGTEAVDVASVTIGVPMRIAFDSADVGLTLHGASTMDVVAVDSGFLMVDASLTTGSFEQSGGLVGGWDITVNGRYVWTGGAMFGEGTTTINLADSTDVGLLVAGESPLALDQRTLRSSWVHWTTDTELVMSGRATLEAGRDSVFDAPGAFIHGDGSFRNTTNLTIAAGAHVVVDVPIRDRDGATWNLGAESTLTLRGESTVDGDYHLADQATLEIAAPVRFTNFATIGGPGRLFTSDGALLVDEGDVAVGTIAGDGGTMTFHEPAEAGALEPADTEIRLVNNVSLRVTGDADLDGSTVAGVAGGSESLTVDGELTLRGEVAFDRVSVTAADLTFAETEPGAAETEVPPTNVYLHGATTKVHIAGTATSAVTATVETDLTHSFGADFRVHDLRVTAGSLELDTPVEVLPDDSVDVAADAVLRMSNVVNRGSFTVAGELDLTGGATIESSIDAVGAARLVVGEDAHASLAAGATIGGTAATVTNRGWIDGAGRLVGTIVNSGLIEPTATLDVVGTLTQTSDGSLQLRVAAADSARLDVLGNATLAGDLDLVIADGAELPGEPFDLVTTTGTLDASLVAVNGVPNCATMRFEAHAVQLVPQPCVTVASASATESAGEVVFPVTLSKPFSELVVIHYHVIPGTAGTSDYVDPGERTLVVPSGHTSSTISIGIVDDDDPEDDETFTLSYTVDGGRAQATEATGTILDDDQRLDHRFQQIPVPGGIQYLSGLGTEYVVGISSPDAETDLPWAYRISDRAFGSTEQDFMPSGINALDQAVGSCNGFADPCMRDHLVDTFLDQPSGTSASPRAIADTGEIVGYVSRWTGSTLLDSPVRWVDAESPAEQFSGLGGGHDQAVDVNKHGVIVGESRFGSDTRGWVRQPDGSVVEIPAQPGLPAMRIAGISDAGVVAGVVSDGEMSSQNFQGFFWTATDGVTLLGPLSSVLDIAPNGDAVGYIDGWATLWRHDGRRIDLNRALGFGHDSESGIHLVAGRLVNDDGAIVVTGSYGPSELTAVLVPPGAGCRVCLDGHLYEREFPTGALIDAGPTIVEGNPAELFADIANHDDTPRTVTVNFFGPDGEPLGDPRTVTVEPDATGTTFAPLDTEGLAWTDAGTDAGPIEVAIEVRDEGGKVIASRKFQTRVVPRPIVNVHGMNSDEATWGGYPAFTANAHTGWKAFAVDEMDTMPWQPNTIAQNAAIMADYVDTIQRQENAWQVDLVAHSMGGLISRYYVQNLMVEHDGIRPARRLVMLGTPNAGSPCADLFSVPMTAELRTDVMHQFNQAITDRRGVPFSIAAGDPLPATCHEIGDGDGVVSLASALTGMTDSGIFDILHTDMTFSQHLFDSFVLPRLNGVLPEMPDGGAEFAAAGSASAVAASPEVISPQLLETNRLELAAGASATFPVTVPSGVDAWGVTGLGTGRLEIELLVSGTVVATSGTNDDLAEFFRSVRTDGPAGGSWTVRVTNHGTTSLAVPLSAWIEGGAYTLSAQAAQVGLLGTVQLTAQLAGPTPPTSMFAVLHHRDGTWDQYDLRDDGTNGDAVAGDGTFSATLPGMSAGPVVFEVYATVAGGTRMTTAGARVAIGSDGPGNDAPVAAPADYTVPGDELTRVDLQAADPEGDELVYEILTLPAHGRLDGAAPYVSYIADRGYQGPDEFTFRVHDGYEYSAPATVHITVGRMNVELLFREPMPPEPTANSPMHVVLRVEGPRDEPVDGGDVTITFDGHTVTAPVHGGRVDAEVPVELPGGGRFLTATFNGTAAYAPATIQQWIRVTEGVAPMPSLTDGRDDVIDGEAGYPVRFFGNGGDADGDVVKYEFDFDGDGIFDAELGAQEYGVAWIDHVYPADEYPDGFHGQARLRVTDAVGHVGLATAAVDIAPHRELGALRRILVDGQPVRLIDVSNDGRYVMYQVTDHEDGDTLPTPFGVLDRWTGETELVSIRPDGTPEDFPTSGALSPDGRTAVFASGEYVDGFWAPQLYIRHLDPGTTDAVPASVNAAGQRANRGAWAFGVTDGGTKVVFGSYATNMTDIDTNRCGTNGTAAPCAQLYVRDTVAGTTTLLSVSHDGAPASIELYGAGMSADGRYVAYTSRGEVWFVDTVDGTRERLFGGVTGDRLGTFEWIGISDDGWYVTGTTEATNLFPDTNGATSDIVRFDRRTGATTVLGLTPSDAQPSRGTAFAMDDACAQRTVFWSLADDLVPGDTNERADIFVREPSGEIRRVSVEARDGTQASHESSVVPLISGDGRYVFFESDAWNLVPGDIEGWRDTFVLDLGTATSCGDDEEPPPPPANRPPIATLSAPSSLLEGSSSPLTVAATDPDGDPLTFTWATDGGTLTASGASAVLRAGDGPATHHVTVVVSDGTASVTVAVDVSIVNVAPTVEITAPIDNPSVTTGTIVAFAATTSDAGGDTVTCHIDWGDGSTLDPAADCAGNHAWSDPATYTVTVTATDKDGAATTATRTVTVTQPAPPPPAPEFHFAGFFAPVDNAPVVNVVKAGSTIPVKFSLGGDFGLDIFEDGYPASAWHSCSSTSPTDNIEETVQPGSSELTYDRGSGRYHYNWKTHKAWAGTCRTLILTFRDGTVRTAEFRFR
jgi:hypothetical protein